MQPARSFSAASSRSASPSRERRRDCPAEQISQVADSAGCTARAITTSRSSNGATRPSCGSWRTRRARGFYWTGCWRISRSEQRPQWGKRRTLVERPSRLRPSLFPNRRTAKTARRISSRINEPCAPRHSSRLSRFSSSSSAKTTRTLSSSTCWRGRVGSRRITSSGRCSKRRARRSSSTRDMQSRIGSMTRDPRSST